MPESRQNISITAPLVIRRADFFAALASPQVQSTLAHARAILAAERFPPRNGRRARGGFSRP